MVKIIVVLSRSYPGKIYAGKREFANKTLRGESTEEGRAEDEEERLDRASLRGD